MKRSSSPPTWFIMLIGVAFVFGGFRLWQEVQFFFREGQFFLPTATLNSRITPTPAPNLIIATRFPSPTPLPECQEYIVTADSVNVRAQPSTIAQVLEIIAKDTVVCVLAKEGEWFFVDRDKRTRRLEAGYIYEPLLRSAIPTPTTTPTVRPAPTITLTFTRTPTPTATATP